MRIPLESQKDAERFMLKTPEAAWIRHWSKLYSAEPHLCGDLAHATRIRDLWEEYGVPSKLVRYDVLQNFPISTGLSLHSSDGGIEYEASLVEPELAEDGTSSPSNGLPAFHGFSANGKVTAQLIYANFGTIQDFALLESHGISVRGKIVICKYSKNFRGLKVRAAEKYGAAAVIIYSDPQEDGEFTQKNGYKPYPFGPARHPESIQRGSVEFFGVAAGDPTTPGWPSLPGKGTKRVDPYGAIPKIPSLPISYKDAIPFLNALDGRGLDPFEIGGKNGDWKGELDEVGYYTGPSAAKVTLLNEGKYKYNPIYNIIGTIEGTGDEMIVLGNHHDSWGCGAVDPVSGSAAMNEVVRGFGRLSSMGWKHERTMYAILIWYDLFLMIHSKYPSFMGRRRIWSSWLYGMGRRTSRYSVEILRGLYLTQYFCQDSTNQSQISMLTAPPTRVLSLVLSGAHSLDNLFALQLTMSLHQHTKTAPSMTTGCSQAEKWTQMPQYPALGSWAQVVITPHSLTTSESHPSTCHLAENLKPCTFTTPTTTASTGLTNSEIQGLRNI